MNPDHYQTEAARTEASQLAALHRLMGWPQAVEMKIEHQSKDEPEPTYPEFKSIKLPNTSVRAIRLLHGMIGLSNEAGEITSIIQKRYWYGKPISDEEMAAKIKDEAGDVCWHLMQVLSSFGVKFSEVLEANLAKLKVRYPDAGWTEEACENRDRGKEAEAQQTPA